MPSQTRSPLEEELYNARETLEKFCTSISKPTFENAKEIIILTIYKFGMGQGAEKGIGIILKNINEKIWSGPIFVKLYSNGAATNVSTTETRSLLIIKNDKFLQTLIEKEELKFDSNNKVTIGYTNNMNTNQNNDIISYSLTLNNQNSSLSFNGDKIVVNNDLMKQVYDPPIQFNYILAESIKSFKNSDYKKIIELLNENILINGKKLKNHNNYNINDENIKDFKRSIESLDRSRSSQERENFCEKNLSYGNNNNNNFTDKIRNTVITKLFYRNNKINKAGQHNNVTNSNNPIQNINYTTNSIKNEQKKSNNIIENKDQNKKENNIHPNESNNTENDQNDNNNNDHNNKNNDTDTDTDIDNDNDNDNADHDSDEEDNNGNKLEKRNSFWNTFKNKLSSKKRRLDLKEYCDIKHVNQNLYK